MDFLGSPVVKTPCFQCRGQGFNPWSGNYDPTYRAVWPKKKKSFWYCLIPESKGILTVVQSMFEHLQWQVTHHLSSWFISPFAALLECFFIYIYKYIFMHTYICTHICILYGERDTYTHISVASTHCSLFCALFQLNELMTQPHHFLFHIL